MIAVSVLLPLAIEIGFRQRRIIHNETEGQFRAFLVKDRPSDLTYVVTVTASVPNTAEGRPATIDIDFRLGPIRLGERNYILSPSMDRVPFDYQIFQDDIPENTELIQLSSLSREAQTFSCEPDRGCFRDLQIIILDDDGEPLLFLGVNSDCNVAV